MPYKVETLHLLCGSEAGENATTDTERNKALLGWVSDSLDPAFKALKHVSDRAGQLFSWEIGKDGLVRVTRAPSASQQRHLRGRARGRASEKREGDRIRT